MRTDMGQYRGKRTKNGEWIEGYLVYANYIGSWRECYRIDPETVGQFTGLTDKNGKKIFEGDILKESDVIHNGETQIIGHVFSVAMRKGCWCVLSKNYFDGWDFLNSHTKLCEIIGNIHDNPELLAENSDID